LIPQVNGHCFNITLGNEVRNFRPSFYPSPHPSLDPSFHPSLYIYLPLSLSIEGGTEGRLVGGQEGWRVRRRDKGEMEVGIEG
jgi:hypothetical protein